MSRQEPASAVWAREVQKALNSPAIASGWTKDQIEAEIARLTDTLKGPLDNVIRMEIVGDRAALRRELSGIPG